MPSDRHLAAVVDDQRERFVRRLEQALRAPFELVAQPALGGREQQALVGEPRRRIDPEVEAGQMPDRFGADADLAVGGNRHRQRVRPARADVAHQHCGAAVDEALGQAVVECVRQARFDLARALGPFGRLGQPVRAVRDIGPAANAGETVGQRLDIAAHIVEPGNLGREPFVGHVAALADIAEQPADHARVMHRPDLAEIGKAARRPQPPRLGAALGGDRRVLRRSASAPRGRSLRAPGVAAGRRSSPRGCG